MADVSEPVAFVIIPENDGITLEIFVYDGKWVYKKSFQKSMQALLA